MQITITSTEKREVHCSISLYHGSLLSGLKEFTTNTERAKKTTKVYNYFDRLSENLQTRNKKKIEILANSRFASSLRRKRAEEERAVSKRLFS